ncbi:MAG: type VI secretion system tip protein VgrG [Bacteroidota bacterium]|nr:type VI secretion system tip protein VgrG [Bacteroidota bacterium]
MPAPSPLNATTTLVTFTVKVNGSPISDSYQVVSIEVNKEINRIPTALIVLRDGSPSEQSFPISDSSDFIPGNPIVIMAGYQSSEEQIFSGIIVQQGLKIDKEDSLIEVVCKDKAVKMTVGRKNTYFNSGDSPVKDSDLISTITGTYGLTATVDSTTVSHSQIFQHYSTDWDFLVARAEANGMIVAVDDGAVNVNAPKVSGTAVLGVTYGDSLLEMESRIESVDQYPSVQATSWDPATQKIVQSAGSDPTVNEQGNLTSSTLSGVVGLTNFSLQSSALVAEDELQAWANAAQLKSWMSRLRGRVRFQGSALAKPDTLIALDGVGERYNGNIYLRGVTHIIEGGDWVTEADFGLEPIPFAETNPVFVPPAQGLLPPVHGLQIGVVKAIKADALGHFRVQVTLPLMQNDGQAVWARMATFYATGTAGAYFYPETGDEVVVGFFDDDPRCPVILGMMHSSKNAAPYTPDDKNTFKAIVSKSLVKIEIDDDKKIITVTTPGKNMIVLSDDAKSITLTDQNSNTITMDSNGIKLDSGKDVTISAKGKVTISATQNIEASSSGGDFSGAGVNVKLTAQAQLTAKGNASAELSAAGQTTVKGAMVMIN